MKWGSIIVPLTSCLTRLYLSVLQIKTKIVSCHTANSKPVKQEVDSTVILPSLVFTALQHSVMFVSNKRSLAPWQSKARKTRRNKHASFFVRGSVIRKSYIIKNTDS
jgi:hypothetical protein